ncbi:MAG: TonB-dependent receptor family protein [Bacteroidales bacterium]|nr:TonB-dependent receptor family protein [Bacteroidales bacterium]
MLVLMLMPLFGYAQRGRISGKVVDKQSGANIEFASVVLLKPADSSMVSGLGAMSASNGSFSISAPYGTYLVRVTFMGYGSYIHSEQVTISEHHQHASLGKLAIAPATAKMEAVQVAAQRSMVEYQLDKRVVNVDKNIVTGGGTATDVLQNVPSVAIDNDGNVSLRGSTNVTVLIDGRPYELMGNDLETLLEQIPASSVENVEVITNPSAKYDPEGMSGIINIKLKDKTAALGTNGVVTLNLGAPLAFLGPNYPDQMPNLIPTSMATINLNYTTQKYSLFLSADGGIRSHGFIAHSNIERLVNGATTSHDTIDQYSVGNNYMGSIKVGGEYFFNEKNSLLASYQLRGGRRNHHNQSYSTDLFSGTGSNTNPLNYMDYAQYDTSHNSNLNHVFNLHYTKKFDQKDRVLTADATFNMRHRSGEGTQEHTLTNPNAQWDNYYLRESETNNKHKALNLQLNYVHPFGEKWKLETGYEGRMDWPDQDAVYYRSQYDALHNLVRNYEDASSTHYNYNLQVQALYATFGGNLNERLSMQLGLRGEYALVNGYDVNHPQTDSVYKSYWQLYPTLHLSYKISENQSMQLSYSRRVRRPHMWDLNPYMDVREGQQLNFGNPNLDPEFTNAFELSYNLTINNLNIFSSAYYRQTNNMMTRYGFVWDSLSVMRYSWWEPYNSEYDGYWASTWQNLDNGYNYGVELIVDYQMTKWWKVNVSLNLYENYIKGTALLDNLDKNAFQLSGKFNSYMTLPHDWTVQLSGQYRAPFLDLQTQMYASYWVDLAVKKDILNKRASINIRVGDVFCTGGWGHETFTSQMNRIVHSKRVSPSLSVGFSYKINNGLRQQSYDSNDEEGEGSVTY